MTHTDNFRGTNMDSRPEEEFSVEVKAIENAQLAYREIVEMMILVMKRRGLTNYQRRGDPDIGIDWLSFNGIEDVLEGSVKEELKRLTDAGYDYTIRPDDCEQFFDRMYSVLRSEPTKPFLSNTEFVHLITGSDVLQPLPNKAMSGFSARQALNGLLTSGAIFDPENDPKITKAIHTAIKTASEDRHE